MIIKFQKASVAKNTLNYLNEILATGQTSGEGPFNIKCTQWLEKHLACPAAILTPSCTSALEMAGTLIGLQPGEQVIMPSFTFPSSANAFVLRGGVPVYVDIEEDTFNIDVNKIEQAITDRTRAILPVHYAGVSCDMEAIMAIAKKHNLIVIEDAAQAIFATDHSRPVGTRGHFSTFSFHETKNIACGEGGALVINNADYVDAAHVYKDNGTNRKAFFEGKVDKYNWQDVGSSIKISELQAAYLLAQLEEGEELTKKRIHVWEKYKSDLSDLENKGNFRLPRLAENCGHNAHIFSLLMNSQEDRTALMVSLKKDAVAAYPHFEPLHLSPAGRSFGLAGSDLLITEDVANRLLRLPIYNDMSGEEVGFVIEKINQHFI